MKQSDRKMAALLIIVGVLILAAIGMLVGMQIGTSRRQQIEQAQAASASAESEAKAASDAAVAQSQADLAAASAQQESEAAKQAEEESAAALLAEQTKEANRENSEVLKGIAALGVPYVSAYADAVKNAQTISAETASSTASQSASTTGTNGHVVCIDAGHQTHVYDSNVEANGPGSDTMKLAVSSGTSGTATGMEEYELNLEVALQLQTELTARGYGVVMTRTTNDVQLTNIDRAEIANNSGAEIMVRIHANSSDDSSVKGALTYAPAADNPYLTPDLISSSTRLATDVINAFCTSTGAENRGILDANDLTGINWTKIPVTYVEMGFMSNAEEDLKMASADYQAQMVQGIANGIDAYFAGN